MGQKRKIKLLVGNQLGSSHHGLGAPVTKNFFKVTGCFKYPEFSLGSLKLNYIINNPNLYEKKFYFFHFRVVPDWIMIASHTRMGDTLTAYRLFLNQNNESN